MTIKAERRKQKLKEEENGWLKATTFKARPNTVTYKEPFRPQRRENHASPMNQDQLKGSREALKAVMKQERIWEQEQMEKGAVAKLRREQVHRAQRIRCYKPLKPKAEIPVTIPQSPQFSHKSFFGNRF
ncbi:targeting protein for Xklp2-like isoform X2 [Sardina pilchardus]